MNLIVKNETIDERERLATLRLLVSEQSAEIRSRREPEHLFTAALLGALGAVAWGVSALSSIPNRDGYLHPALFGIIAAFLITGAVTAKVLHENLNYRKLRKEQLALLKLLRKDSGIKEAEIPSGLRSGADTKGTSMWWSLAVSWLAAVAIGGFCYSVWQNAPSIH